MDLIIHTLFDTDWGVIILGALLLIFLLVEYFNKTPRI